MANIHTRTFIVLMIISIITLEKVHFTDQGMCLLTHSFDSSHKQMEGVLSQTLGEELIFNYTDSFSESTFLFSIHDLNLTRYNELTLNFYIEGDKSSKAGISAIFEIGSAHVEFLIEKTHQQTAVYSLSRGFTYDIPAVEDVNISATLSGQATYGNSGSLIILANSTILNLDTIDITETEQVFELTPSFLLFEGNMVGLREISVSSAFNNSFNSSYMVDLTIRFNASDFQSFSNEVILLVDSIEVGRSSFVENSFNEINFQFEASLGFVFLEMAFQINICTEIVEISNIEVTGKVVENTLNTDIFNQFSWNNGIDETVNLTSLKPYSANNEQILNVSLDCSFEGTTVIEGIEFDLYSGSQKIDSGVISVLQQNGEIQSIRILTYSDNYQDDLLLKFSAEATGSGTITIFNSTTILIRDIIHVTDNEYERYLEEHITFPTPIYGAVTKNYVDIVYIENTTVPYQLELLMELSASDSNFQSISLSLFVNDVAISTKSILDEGDVHLVFQVVLNEAFNEIRFSLSILGQGSTLTFENMRYLLKQGVNDSNNPLIPQNEFNIPFFKVPKNIFLGIFVLFDCWLVMGIMMRIYKGRKLRKKQQAENDEFILEIFQLTKE